MRILILILILSAHPNSALTNPNPMTKTRHSPPPLSSQFSSSRPPYKDPGLLRAASPEASLPNPWPLAPRDSPCSPFVQVKNRAGFHFLDDQSNRARLKGRELRFELICVAQIGQILPSVADNHVLCPRIVVDDANNKASAPCRQIEPGQNLPPAPFDFFRRILRDSCTQRQGFGDV